MAKDRQAQIELERRERNAEARTTADAPVVAERRQLEHHIKVQRAARSIPPPASADDEEIQFMQALEAYKRTNGRMFPTCSEILEVVRGLGYVRLTPGAECHSWHGRNDSAVQPTD